MDLMALGRRLPYRSAAAAALLLGVLAAVGCAPLGASPEGARLARTQRSPQWHGKGFENPQPIWTNLNAAFRHALFGRSAPATSPTAPIVAVNSAAALRQPPISGLRITWFGHSSSLIELDGVRILTDPLWSMRISPVAGIGPKRWFAPPIALSDLPAIDAVIISHDHYDHLDYETIRAMRSWQTLFVVPLGIGAHLARWGIPEARILELDWWESARIGAVQIVSTPSRHSSGRVSTRSNRTLWSSYALVGPQHRAWYSGDTGFHDGLAQIGERFGPFDVTLMESGQYNANWPDSHLGPEQAVEAHLRVRGKAMLPVHWALIQLAEHTWTEPIERVLVAARCRGVEVLTPRPGESIEPGQGAKSTQWWPQLPWQTASTHPIVATLHGKESERVQLPPCGSEK